MKLNLVKPNKENLNTFVAIGSALVLVGFFDFLANYTKIAKIDFSKNANF